MANEILKPADVATPQQVFNPLQKEVIGAINLVDESTKNIATYENEENTNLGEDGKPYNVEYSASYDNQHPMMEDYIPESMIRVYPYRGIKNEAKDFSIQPNQITIIRVNQKDVDDFKNLKKDENGNVYFEIIAAIDNTTKLALDSKPENMVKAIRKLKTFTAITTNYYDTRNDLPDFFTIDKPFNRQEYKEGNQIVYFGSSFTPAYLEDVQDLADDFLIEDESKLAEIVLADISQLEEQFSKAKIDIIDDGTVLYNPTITYFDEDLNKLVTKPGIRLRTNPYALINNIRAKGLIEIGKFNENNEFKGLFKVENTDIDFNSYGKFAPIKMSPDKVLDKTVMYADWFDYNITMPYFAADFFRNGNKLHDLKYSTEKIRSTKSVTKSDMVNNGDISIDIEPTLTSNLPLSDLEIHILINTIVDNAWINHDLEFVLKNPVKRIENNLSNIHYDDIEMKAYHGKDAGNIVVKLTNINYKENSAGNYSLNFKTLITSNFNNNNGSWVSDGIKIVWNKIIEEEILQVEDWRLIEDLIILSAGFKDSWRKAPKDSDHPDKIYSGYRVGHAGILISSVSDKKPADVIDGMIAAHEDKHPSFRSTKSRYLAFRFMLNALSKYIISNVYTTNGGLNELNGIALPWFLMLSGKKEIDYSSNPNFVIVSDIAVDSKGDVKDSVGIAPKNATADGSIRQSWMLSGVKYAEKADIDAKTHVWGDSKSLSDLEFTTNSSFFRNDFSKLNNYRYEEKVENIKNINISSLKIAETDRKVILPELKDTITETVKVNIPGQNTGTDEYLSNHFFIPIKDEKDIKRIYLSGKKENTKISAGDTIDVIIPPSEAGKEGLKDQEIISYINELYDNIEPVTADQIRRKRVKVLSESLWGGSRADGAWHASSLWTKTSLQRNFYSGGRLSDSFDYVNVTASFGSHWKKVPDSLIKSIYLEQFHYDDSMIELPAGMNTLEIQKEKRLNSAVVYWWWDYFIDFNGDALFDIYRYEYEPIKIKFSKDSELKTSNPQLEDRQIYFDKTQWIKFINNNLQPANEQFTFFLTAEDDVRIEFIDQIMLSSIWGDEVRIYYDTIPYGEELVYQLPSKTDETVGIQRITVM